jgi:hypothetical protein
VHEVTGFSPAYLTFGRTLYASGKLHKRLQPISVDAEISFGSRDALNEHLQDLANVYDRVKKRLRYQREAIQFADSTINSAGRTGRMEKKLCTLERRRTLRGGTSAKIREMYRPSANYSERIRVRGFRLSK